MRSVRDRGAPAPRTGPPPRRAFLHLSGLCRRPGRLRAAPRWHRHPRCRGRAPRGLEGPRLGEDRPAPGAPKARVGLVDRAGSGRIARRAPPDPAPGAPTPLAARRNPGGRHRPPRWGSSAGRPPASHGNPRRRAPRRASRLPQRRRAGAALLDRSSLLLATGTSCAPPSASTSSVATSLSSSSRRDRCPLQRPISKRIRVPPSPQAPT